MSKLQPAISRLAALYEYGELMASSDPVNFLDTVTKELAALRGVAKAARAVVEDRAKRTTTCATYASCKCVHCGLAWAINTLPKESEGT